MTHRRPCTSFCSRSENGGFMCFVQFYLVSGGGLVLHQRLQRGQKCKVSVLFLRLKPTRISQIRPRASRLPLTSTSSLWSHGAHLSQIHFHSPLLQGFPALTPGPRSLLPLGGMVTFFKSIYSLHVLLHLNFQLHRKERSLCSLIFKYLFYV